MILRAYKVHGLPLTRDAVTSLSHSALSPPQPASNCALPSIEERAKANPNNIVEDKQPIGKLQILNLKTVPTQHSVVQLNELQDEKMLQGGQEARCQKSIRCCQGGVRWGREVSHDAGMVLYGVRKVSDDLRKVSDGVRKVPDGVRKVLDGLKNVLDGIKNMSDDVRKVSDGIMKALKGVKIVSHGVGKVSHDAGKVSHGAQKS